ncbi:uncharacterized protein Aud_008911 [Aspergillus udagawae]|uniref:GPI anchored protein n=1 Tax=Aspergillus udagawae TaxID=91492 RepID=A0A8E0QY27_9EURO|nr:uncharacterized protein Aud_008911 [Aspergillus udagawae]GIC92445.1 hypothetical protein Aud_008911 [Aspergillus udagawae]
MARFAFLLLASAISLTTTASSVKRDSLQPFQKGRFAPSNNASTSLAYDNNLLPRYYKCLPGAHMCDAGQCCDFTCCSDGSCCPAAQLCYNDVKPSNGPTYCCEMYTEKECDTRCVPMLSECCGDGFYCEYGYACSSGGCCKWGHTCSGSYDDVGGGGGSGDHDSTTSSTSTKGKVSTTSKYTTHTEEHTTTSYSDTESTTASSTTESESNTRTRSTDSDSATETTETDSSSLTSTSTSSRRTTSFPTVSIFTPTRTFVPAAPAPTGRVSASGANKNSFSSLNTGLLVVVAAAGWYFAL